MAVVQNNKVQLTRHLKRLLMTFPTPVFAKFRNSLHLASLGFIWRMLSYRRMTSRACLSARYPTTQLPNYRTTQVAKIIRPPTNTTTPTRPTTTICKGFNCCTSFSYSPRALNPTKDHITALTVRNNDPLREPARASPTLVTGGVTGGVAGAVMCREPAALHSPRSPD